jgi:hypothetical protein
MNLLVAAAIIVGAAAIGGLLMAAVRHWMPAEDTVDPGRGSSMLTLVGTAFAVLLAFITLAAFQTYNGAKSGAASEASAVLEMSRTSEFFPAAQRLQLRSDLVCYARAVINEEWPAMRRGESAPLVDHWVEAYRNLFDRLDLHSARERLGFQELLTEARDRTDGRRERLTQATPSVPTPLWLVLVLGGLVAVLLQLAMADPRERWLVQCTMIAGVAAVVAAGLLLVYFLDHPYEDRTGSIQPTEMRSALAMIQAAEPGLRPACDQSGEPSGRS